MDTRLAGIALATLAMALDACQEGQSADVSPSGEGQSADVSPSDPSSSRTSSPSPCPTDAGSTPDECVNPAGLPMSLCGGECVYTLDDPAHCGCCDNACEPGEACQNGQCTPECSGEDEMICGGRCVSRWSSSHCGECGNACYEISSTTFCFGPTPVCKSCEPGEGFCGGSRPAGAPDYVPDCVDLQTDPNHCGQCGRICPMGETCAKGECG